MTALEDLRITPNSRSASARVGLAPRIGMLAAKALGGAATRLQRFVAAGKIGMNDDAVEGLVALAARRAPPPAVAAWSRTVHAPPPSALRILNLSSCSAVSDRALVALAAACPHLQVLSVAGSMSVSDVGVCTLAMHCRTLRTVSLRLAGGVPSVYSPALAGSLLPGPHPFTTCTGAVAELTCIPPAALATFVAALADDPAYRGSLRPDAAAELVAVLSRRAHRLRAPLLPRSGAGVLGMTGMAAASGGGTGATAAGGGYAGEGG